MLDKIVWGPNLATEDMVGVDRATDGDRYGATWEEPQSVATAANSKTATGKQMHTKSFPQCLVFSSF